MARPRQSTQLTALLPFVVKGEGTGRGDGKAGTEGVVFFKLFPAV